ncbi:MAG TPA: helix-turn-helix domain-containing protein [Candidatus Dormibacteraeota bacterium]|nr:helix-turn-helix domain-containing protein [Candidatus Dormibacteraeota bacterium]
MTNENSSRPLRTDVGTHRALSEVSRVRILEELERSPTPLDVNQLAERLGLHHNTIRAHLEVLARAGLVISRPERRTVPGRPRTVYRLAPTASAGDDGSGYRLLAEILASYLAGSIPDPRAAAVEAGQAWGRFLVERPSPFERLGREQVLDRVQQLLAKLGFRPQIENGHDTVRVLLHRCPFHDLATRHPEVTCAVHQGLMQGALRELQAEVDVNRLDPFVAPSLCVAELVQAEPTPSS